MTTEITVYSDYKSPYAYLAVEPAYRLERTYDVTLTWLPYTLDIPSFLGAVEDRDENQWRKVRYAYMDARRLANKRGLIVRGPKQIYDSSIAAIGMLFARRAGVFRAYHDRVFERFWKRELAIEDVGAIAGVLAEAGADTAGFPAFLDGDGRRAHDRICAEAQALGVFGVPTFVLDGELFWGGDRLYLLEERLAAG